MTIELRNLPTNQVFPVIKAIRFCLVKANGEPYGLIEAKNLVSKSKSVFSIKGEQRKLYFGKPITKEMIFKYLYTSETINGVGHCGCDLPLSVKLIISDSKKTNIKTKGNQILNVPNTEEGRKFLEDMQKYMNHSAYSFKKRGRGSRQKSGDQSFIPLQDAEWIAVYSTKKRNRLKS